MNCSTCGTSLAGGARFCPICGAVILSGNPISASPALTNDVKAVSQRYSVAEQSKPEARLGYAIDDKYRLDAMLGVGGMGTVYRATRLLIGDSVAVKLLHPEQVADSQAVERFRREAQAAARLKHQNAVTIYDFGVSNDGLVYLVMELVEGRSLRDIIKHQGPLTPSAAAEIFDQAGSALDEAHRQNIIHRDIKPDNIMVNAKPGGVTVKVLDFGIAKLRDLATTASNLTQTGSVVGTPHYMSPEQCLGEELDHRSDIYSLGVVLYEALTGILPFNSPTSAAVVVQQVTQAPPSLRSINMSVSPVVEAVVLHALEKQRGARPQTAGALAQELIAAVRGTTASPSAASGSWGIASPLSAFGGAAPGLAPTVQMAMPKSSGSVTPVSISPLTSEGPSAAWPTSASPASAASKRRLPIVIGVIVAAALAVAMGVYLGAGSPKRNILSEIKKGNLVKPEGSSAYDIYLTHAAKLSANDKAEIANEAIPNLEKRGDEIMAAQKQPAYESEAEMVEGARVYGWLNELRPKAAYESRKLFSEGRLAFSKKDYDRAMTAYRRSVELDPSLPLALNGLGRVYVNMNDYYNARQYYTRATQSDPRWISPWMNLGALTLSRKDYSVAEDSMRHALEIDPQKASAHDLLAQIYEKTDRWCDAVREYKLALDNASNAANSSFNAEATKHRLERLAAKYSCY
jgi:eukaryotic-like serine/threonine-protein kinase